jgi:phenylpropionate dioxygenase-like ring-hydroxylating dioxygenase large terminal subunit
VLAGAGQTLEQAETLPPLAHLSHEFYALEVERSLRQEWICVGHVSQVPRVRATDAIRVMSRICLHRCWAPLVSEPGNAKLFSCPFHK